MDLGHQGPARPVLPSAEIALVELLTTSDPVRLSYLQAVLKDARIDSYVFDTAAPWPGAIPVRLMVLEEDEAAARRLLDAHDEG